jgi:hypothetical protein
MSADDTLIKQRVKECVNSLLYRPRPLFDLPFIFLARCEENNQGFSAEYIRHHGMLIDIKKLDSSNIIGNARYIFNNSGILQLYDEDGSYLSDIYNILTYSCNGVDFTVEDNTLTITDNHYKVTVIANLENIVDITLFITDTNKEWLHNHTNFTYSNLNKGLDYNLEMEEV